MYWIHSTTLQIFLNMRFGFLRLQRIQPIHRSERWFFHLAQKE